MRDASTAVYYITHREGKDKRKETAAHQQRIESRDLMSRVTRTRHFTPNYLGYMQQAATAQNAPADEKKEGRNFWTAAAAAGRVPI